MTVRLLLLEKDRGVDPPDMRVGDSIELHLNAVKPVGIIGRAAGVDVLLSAPSVGRRVVSLTLAGQGVWLKDLGSAGGSSLTVEGLRTERPDCICPNGALLTIGRMAFRVEITPS